MKVGFIGLGRMGAGIAANLLKAGYTLTVYNRTREKTDALARAGARVAAAPIELADCEVIMTMLADDAAVAHIMLGTDGILSHLPPGTVHISLSTIGVEFSAQLAAAHAAARQGYVAAPVFGRPEAAAAAQLFIVTAGPLTLIERCTPLFKSIGQRSFHVSERPELANLVKLSGNFLIAAVLESLGEALALIGKAGLDSRQYLELLTSTLFNVPLYKNYGAALVEQRFQPAGFAAALGLKDLRLALAAAEQLRVPMPLASLLRDRFLTLIAQGGEQLDWSAIGRLAANDAGLPSL